MAAGKRGDHSKYNELCKKDNPDIADRLKQARRDEGITQKEFAEELELSRSYINAIENGRVKIPAFIVKAYCDELDVPSEQLLGTDYGFIELKSARQIRDSLFQLPQELSDPINQIIQYFEKKGPRRR